MTVAALVVAMSITVIFLTKIHGSISSMGARKMPGDHVCSWSDRTDRRLPPEPKYKPDSFYDMAGKDLGAELQKAKSLKGEPRESAVKAVLTAALSLDPEFVANELNDSGLSQIGLTQVADGLMSRWPDSAKALSWARSNLVGSLRARATAIALARLVNVSPSEAVTIFNTLPPGNDRSHAFTSMALGWLNSDIAAAMDFAINSSDYHDSSVAMTSIAKPLVAMNPEIASEYLDEFPDDQRFIWLAHELAVAKVEESPSDALAWALALEGVTGVRARRSAIIAWVGKDIPAVANFISASNEDIQLQLAPILASTWVEQDSAAASTWISDMRGAGVQQAAVGPFLYSWLQIAPYEAANWLANLPAGPTKDLGASILAVAEGRARPTAAYVALLKQYLDDINFFHRSLPLRRE